MIRRPFAIVAILSAGIAILITMISVRGRFAQDEILRCRWDPVARTYGELRIANWGGVLSISSEVDAATPTENTAVAQQKAGITGTRWIHAVEHHWSNGYMGEPTFIWADRYRAGPLLGINPSGVADCWTVMVRTDAAAAAFCALPGAWIVIRVLRRRRNHRGFSPIAVAAPHNPI